MCIVNLCFIKNNIFVEEKYTYIYNCLDFFLKFFEEICIFNLH